MTAKDITDLEELKEVYGEVRRELLREAERRGLDPHYYYENQSESEIPEGFTSRDQVISISLSDSKLFQRMAMGNLDQLRELLDDQELFSEYLNEIFGSYDQFRIDTQKPIENEDRREAA